MILSEVIKELDRCLIPSLAYEWDNVGWTIGREDKEIRNILLTLEINQAVIQEAKAQGVDLIISHHPLIFKGLKNITTANEKGKQVYELIKSDIAVYSCHTNYDIIKEGLNDYVAGLLGLSRITSLTEEESSDKGIGRCGELQNAMSMEDFCRYLQERLGVKDLRVIHGNDRMIRRVGIVTGSGSEFLPLAMKKGCDVFVTGDMKYHDAQDALSAGWNVIDAGHYSTEIVFNQSIQEFLEKHLQGEFNYIQSKELGNPFQVIGAS